MKELIFMGSDSGRKTLREFTRLGLAFYAGLLLISCYQQVRLSSQGILDSFFGTNLLLSALHHLGYAAILALVVSFAFKALESRKPGLGARLAAIVFLGALGVEFLLTEYFVTRYNVPIPGIPGSYALPPEYLVLRMLLGCSALYGWFVFAYRRSVRLQWWINRMYPFTIVLFSMFLATLLSDKRPVNQNKTELVFTSWFSTSETLQPKSTDPHPRYGIPPVSPRDMIWIHSVFSGDDFDRAYQIARRLAHEGQLDGAMRLTSHILWEVPGHVDAEILMGRLLSWEESYEKSEAILEQVISAHPEYEDAYAALLDAYFWSGHHGKALEVQPLIEAHLGGSSLLASKLQRSHEALQDSGAIASETPGPASALKTHQP
ncbi:MAG: hypothetical protein R3252_08265 [Robiginitalea sp.]|nr:hypothetical protein [Robiginitalea sp.]